MSAFLLEDVVNRAERRVRVIDQLVREVEVAVNGRAVLALFITLDLDGVLVLFYLSCSHGFFLYYNLSLILLLIIHTSYLSSL